MTVRKGSHSRYFGQCQLHGQVYGVVLDDDGVYRPYQICQSQQGLQEMRKKIPRMMRFPHSRNRLVWHGYSMRLCVRRANHFNIKVHGRKIRLFI